MVSGLMVQACEPSSLGNGGKRNISSRPAWATVSSSNPAQAVDRDPASKYRSKRRVEVLVYMRP